MIKENESNVANIDFKLQAKRGDTFLCFTLFKNLKELIISLQPRFQERVFTWRHIKPILQVILLATAMLGSFCMAGYRKIQQNVSLLFI